MIAVTEQNVLGAEVMRALSALTTPKFLATRNEEGVPNVVPVLSLEAFDEKTIVFGEMMIWKTRQNLEIDPRVSVLVLSPDLRSWSIRGRFLEFQRSGIHFDRVSSRENARYNPYGSYRSAGVIEVLAVVSRPKPSQLGLLQEAVRCRLLARSLSHDASILPVMPLQVSEKFGRLKAAKALAVLDASGHPDSIPALSLVPAGRGRLVFTGPALGDAVVCGSEVAAAVLSMEPVAYQVKGVLAEPRRSLGRTFGVIDLREAFSASPPLPGERLPLKP